MSTIFAVDLPLWALAGLVFSLRILDVSLGTMRTISVVTGRMRLSVFLGFFEVLLWILVVSQVILRLQEHPVLVIAYAGGFATGNAIGIILERKLALGRCVVRVISTKGEAVAKVLESLGRVLGIFQSEINGYSSKLVFSAIDRRHLDEAMEKARKVDPELFYVVERFSETSHLSPLPHASGWRAILKKK